MLVSSEKSRWNQSDDQSAIIIHIWGFGGKCSEFTREPSETAPFGGHHLDWSETLWAGLTLSFRWWNWESRCCWMLYSSVGRRPDSCLEILALLLVWVLCRAPVFCNLLVYHVNRGQNKTNIFRTNTDKQLFNRILKRPLFRLIFNFSCVYLLLFQY